MQSLLMLLLLLSLVSLNIQNLESRIVPFHAIIINAITITIISIIKYPEFRI